MMNRVMRVVKESVLAAMVAVLVISMSGLTQLSEAATSCNATWYTTYAGVQYKYSDKLEGFTSYRGKTYAYAKGAATGGQEKISSGLSNGKAVMYGFQQYISYAYPGASLPVVSDGAVQQMLRDVFGPLITNAQQTGIYLGEMNKNDGAGYINMDGSGAATYYNWVPGEPNPGTTCHDKNGTTVKDPYVFMLPDGTWKTICDGTLAPVFVFDGVFDCATPYAGTGSIPGTGPSNVATGPVGSLKPCDTTNYDGFVLKDNTTYAITKNALTWAEAKTLVTTSVGKLAFVGDQATNDFLVTAFSPLMGASQNVTGNKAWIGLYDPASVASWCMPGTTPCPTMPQRFQWTSDVSSYSNWAAGQPDNYCTAAEMAVNIDHLCYGENWAVLSSDGKWYDEGDHGATPTRLKAIVQWKDQMSCTSTITPPPPPPGDKTLDTANGLYCTDSRKEQLKNCSPADPPTPLAPHKGCPTGYTLSAAGTSCDATAPCPNNACTVPVSNICPDWAVLDANSMCVPAQNSLCPLEKVLCTDVFETPSCPDGGVLEPIRHMCQLPPTVNCGAGYVWDTSIDRCVADVICSDNGVFSQTTQRCEKVAQATCSPGYTIDANGLCIAPATCPAGGSLSTATGRCEMPVTYVCSAQNYSYNAVDKLCEMEPLCPPGSVFSAVNQRCEQAPGNCPPSYTYNPTTKTCTADPVCSEGTFSTTSNTCEMPGTPVCNSGWVYNQSTARCEQPPACQAPGVYDPATKLCLAPIAGATCAANYHYDPATKTCFQQPVCPSGSFVNNRCEEAPTCSGSGFSFNAATGRCEQAPGNCPPGFTFSAVADACTASPVCPDNGVLNNSSNLCELQVTTSCNSGWTLNGSGRCEQPPACQAPGVFDPVGKYCSAPVTSIQCPANYTWDSNKKLCVENPICPSGSYSAANGRCEATPACPGSSTFNTSTGRCEQNPDGCGPGYTYSASLDKCVAAPICPGGAYDPSGKCIASATPTCSSGTYNSGTGMCEQIPYCNAPGVYSASADKCLMDPAVGCQSGYTLDVALGSCTAAPQCLAGTSYSPALKTCQAPSSYVCSDATYTFNVATSRCEKAPVCVGGSYNSTYNKCLENIVIGCSGAGFTYNSARNRCEKVPECPLAGYLYNGSTNKCEKPASVPVNCTTCDTANGYTWNGSICVKTYPAALTGGAVFDLPVHVNFSWECSDVSYSSGPVYGYASSSSPVGTELLQIPAAYSGALDVCLGPAGCPDTGAWGFGAPVHKGYLSSTQITPSFVPFYGFEPACGFSMWNGSSFGGPEINGIAGYLAPASGAYGGTYTCPSGGTLSGTTCTAQAAPVCQNYAATATGGAVFDVPVYRNPSATYREALLYSSSSNAPSLYGYVARPSSTGNGLLPMYDGDVDYFIKTANAPHLVGYASNTDPGGWIKLFQDDYLNLEVLWRLDSGVGVVADFGYISPTPQTMGATYTCPNGGTLSGTQCVFSTSYPATVTGGAVYDVPIAYETPAACEWNFYSAMAVPWMTQKVYGSSISTGGPAVTLWSGASSAGTAYGSPISIPGAMTAYPGGSGNNGISFEVCAGSTPAGYFPTVAGTYGASYTCPSGGTLSGTQCVTGASACPDGSTPVAGICQSNPVCSGVGVTFDGNVDACWAPSVNSCPGGMVYDSTIGFCAVAATCSNGVLDGSADKCYQTATLSCPAGTTNVSGACVATPSCSGTGVFSSSLDKCTAAGDLSCNPGYTVDNALGKCVQNPNCASGTLNTTADLCQSSPTLTCPAGLFLVGSSCQVVPTCPPIGSLSIASGFCEATGGACGSGFTLDPAADKCFGSAICANGSTLAGSVCASAASCDSGGSLNGALGICSAPATFVCPSSYNYSPAADLCTKTVDCGTGSLNQSTLLCEMANTTTCPTNYSIVGSVCQLAPVCDPGSTYSPATKACVSGVGPCTSGSTLDSSLDICYSGANCPSSMTLSAGGICTSSAVCEPGGSLDTATSLCRGNATFSCDAGFSYSPVSGQCFQTPSCAPGNLDTLLDICSVPNTLSCSPGFTLSGTKCQMIPACAAGGTLNTGNHLCDAGGNACNASWTLDPAKDVCHQLATCPGGSYDSTLAKCTSQGAPTCPAPGGAYTYDMASDLCISPAVCSPGVFDPALNSCKMAIGQDCGTYTLDQTAGVCFHDVSCPQDPAFSLASTIGFAASINKCASDADHQCTTAYGYNGLPVEKCEAVPICARGVFNPIDNSCSTGTGNCPIGDYACMSATADTDINPATGKKYLYCSPNTCTDNTQGMVTTDDTTTGEDDILNDGETDDNGNCINTLYIFNGKDMRCRKVDRNGQINSYAKLIAQIVLMATGVGAALAGAMLAMTAAQVATTIAGQVLTAAINAAITIASNVVIDAATGQLGQGTLMAAAMTCASAVMSAATAYYNGSEQFVEGATKSTTDTTTGMTTTITNGAKTEVSVLGNTNGAITDATKGMTALDSAGGPGIKVYTDTFSPDAGGLMGGGTKMVTVLTDAAGNVTILEQTVSSTASSMSALLMAQARQLADDWGPVMATGMLSNYSATKCCFPDKMGASCKPEEFQEAKMQHGKMCHVVGTYCSSKFLGWCVVEKQTSCCFNSVLARIFHEQGRPQLATFTQPIWGSPKKPKCRGFLAVEFQNLDFGTMDLGEYIDTVTTNTEALMGDIQNYMNSVQTDAKTKVQNQVQQNSNGL